MSQKTITAFFSSRKRPATEDIVSAKNKIPHLDRSANKSKVLSREPILFSPKNCEITTKVKVSSVVSETSQNIELSTGTEDHDAQAVQSSKPNAASNEKTSEIFGKKSSATNIANNSTNRSKQGAIKNARKELSLGDIRKKLSNSPRLAELRAAADQLSQGIQQLTEGEDKKNLKQFKSINIEVPVSPSKKVKVQNELLSPKKAVPTQTEEKVLMSPRKVVVSPVKSPSKIPAYMRHASLATSSTSLPLPHHYRFLAELFRGMETVVSLLFNRKESITFSKLKPSVQEMLKRNFTEKHLAQIKHLVPDFYNYEVQKCKAVSNSQKEAYELIVTPNFPNHPKIMSPTVLLERRRYFYDILLRLVKKHHSQYLQSLDPPMVIPDEKLTRWHPEFELEKIAEVECAKLPEMPNNETYSTAQDVLAKARELFKCNTKMERALEKLSQAKARGLTDKEKTITGFGSIDAKTDGSQPSTSNYTILNPALRNLPASLLEKVKAKQAAKALEAMTRSSEDEKKYMLYTRLPDLVRTLRNIYVTERKNVLALNIILSKLNSSFKSIASATDLQRDIKILSEEFPDWIHMQHIRNTDYIKLDRNADLKKIQGKLEMLAQKYKPE